MGCGQSSTASGRLTELKARLPVDRTQEDQEKRTVLYQKFDVRKSNSLSEQECLNGCRRHLELENLTDQLPLVNKRAYEASRSMRSNTQSTAGVDPSEFRLYLSYLRFYFELNEMFTEVDTSKKRELTRDEFKKGVPKLEQWGLRLGNPDKEYDDIGAKGKGATFDEFSDWAIRKQLAANQNRDPADAAAERRANDKIVVPIPIRGSEEMIPHEVHADVRDLQRPTRTVQPATAPPVHDEHTTIVRHTIVEQMEPPKSTPQDDEHTTIVRHTVVEEMEPPKSTPENDEHTTIVRHTIVEQMEPPAHDTQEVHEIRNETTDEANPSTTVVTTRVIMMEEGPPLTYAEEAALRKAKWEELKLRLPRQRTPEQNAARDELFQQFDPNGSGKLSFAEVEFGALTILKLHEFTRDYKMILQRAFNTARTAAARRGNKEASTDFVERIEFRLLLVYIYDYFELWVMFDELDTSGDRKVSLAEFKHALPKLEEWGVKIEDAEATFGGIDKDGSGAVNFDEFCEWAINQHLDADGEENTQ